MTQTRISPDVWKLAQQVAEQKGLGSPRVAIEAIVRTYAEAYMQGLSVSQPVEAIVTAVPSQSKSAFKPAFQPNGASAQDALSDLISEL
jgi:hypothetical protein